jgi:hypothetical protein
MKGGNDSGVAPGCKSGPKGNNVGSNPASSTKTFDCNLNFNGRLAQLVRAADS